MEVKEERRRENIRYKYYSPEEVLNMVKKYEESPVSG